MSDVLRTLSDGFPFLPWTIVVDKKALLADFSWKDDNNRGVREYTYSGPQGTGVYFISHVELEALRFTMNEEGIALIIAKAMKINLKPYNVIVPIQTNLASHYLDETEGNNK